MITVLLLRLGTSSGEVFFTSQLNPELTVNTDKEKYWQGDRVRAWANLSTPQPGIMISFEIDDPTLQPLLILSRVTNASGIAAINFTLSDNATMGSYNVHASTTNSTAMTIFEIVSLRESDDFGRYLLLIMSMSMVTVLHWNKRRK
jgi:uncharacterized protein YfaS (alpha-2-macroglobulin family)